MVRLTLHEDHPGEAREKAPELIKALVARLGGRATSAGPKGHAHEDGQSTFRALREHSATLDALARTQIDRMLADVQRYVETRGQR